MRCSRRLPLALAAVLAAVLGSAGTFAPRAMAQQVDQLGSAITEAESLNNQQRTQIDTYIAQWAGLLRDSGDDNVERARRRLLEPLRSGRPSDEFMNHYSNVCGREMAPALSSDDPLVRLNTLIVVRHLTGEAAVPLIDRGLDDESPAVRYWAVKAIKDIASAGRFDRDEQRNRMNRLVEHFGEETSVAVSEQTMLALVELELPEAKTRALEIINERVASHVSEPGRSLQPELAGIHRAYRQTLGASRPAEQGGMLELARTAMRYHDLAGQQLQRDVDDAEVRDSYVRTIELTDAILRFVHSSLDVGPPPRPLPPGENWDRVRANAEQWRDLLGRPPYNFNEVQLSVGG
ncbi:MAG: HEAT repeat domain-containing protein [Phycisphaeraceae bacterium]